jgi:hypothetical protein
VKNDVYDSFGGSAQQPPLQPPYDAFGNAAAAPQQQQRSSESSALGSKRDSGSLRNNVYSIATSPNGTQYYTADNLVGGGAGAHYSTAGNAPAAYATAGSAGAPVYATAGDPSSGAYYSTAGNVPSPVYVTAGGGTTVPTPVYVVANARNPHNDVQYDTAGNLVPQHSAVEYDTPSNVTLAKKETLRRGGGAQRNDVYSVAAPGGPSSASHYSTASSASRGGNVAPAYATASVSTPLTRAEAQYALASQSGGGAATYAIARGPDVGASSTDTYALAGRGGHDSDEDGC